MALAALPDALFATVEDHFAFDAARARWAYDVALDRYVADVRAVDAALFDALDAGRPVDLDVVGRALIG